MFEFTLRLCQIHKSFATYKAVGIRQYHNILKVQIKFEFKLCGKLDTGFEFKLLTLSYKQEIAKRICGDYRRTFFAVVERIQKN